MLTLNGGIIILANLPSFWQKTQIDKSEIYLLKSHA
ncbi:Uncharacterised protein [Candidatus Ornithobacterium hominis]|nr:Uncharacterised protein [Candidatus Ornithobacterium hominis]